MLAIPYTAIARTWRPMLAAAAFLILVGCQEKSGSGTEEQIGGGDTGLLTDVPDLGAGDAGTPDVGTPDAGEPGHRDTGCDA